MTAPLLDVDAARIHVATVLVEQGYAVDKAHQAAQRIVYKCAVATTSAVKPQEAIEEGYMVGND